MSSMTTDALIERFLAAGDEPTTAAVAALLELLDDATIDGSAPPKSVAEAARIVGLSTHTLRYYEQQGLVRPGRNSSGYREYSAFDLRRLVFLTRMRMSGMTIHDLKRYIALVDEGESTVPVRRDIMLAQRDRIARQIRELTLALETTEFKLRVYGGAPTPAEGATTSVRAGAATRARQSAK